MSDHRPPQYPSGNQSSNMPGQQPYTQPGFGEPSYGQPYDETSGTPGFSSGADTHEPPLWAPWYGISFAKAVTRVFKKYARFDGRASRSEFWWFMLLNAIIDIVLYGAFLTLLIIGAVGRSSSQYDPATGTYVTQNSGGSDALIVISFIPLALLIIWSLVIIVPSLALGWRRLHDAGFAGPLWLLSFVFAGVAAIVFGFLPSNPSGARYDRPGPR